jgi:hypothetical protein
MQNLIQIKTVFGALQGNINKRCELVYSKNDLYLWLILSQDDRSLCLEKGGELYRVGHEDQLNKFKEIIDNDSILDLIEARVTQWEKTFNDNKNDKIFANVNFFALCDKVEVWFKIRQNNELIDTVKQENKDYEEKRLLEEKMETEKARIAKVIEDIKNDNYITCKDLVKIADQLNVPIHLRTRGWLLNTGSCINTKYQTFDDRKKRKGSPKAFEVLHAVRSILIVNPDYVS